MLSTIGKAIETVIASWIAETAEERNLLPEGQMGNHKGRNAELAMRVVTDAIYSSRKQR